MTTLEVLRARLPKPPIVIPDRVALRALRAFTLDRVTGCHVSTYSVASHGHAQIGWQDEDVRRVVTAQRAAWVAVWGQVPDGQVVRVTCRNLLCVNLAHLQLLSNFEAARRIGGRDWTLGECVNGHPNEWFCLATWLAIAEARKRTASQSSDGGVS